MSLETSPVFQNHARVVLLGSLFALIAATLYGGNVPAARVASLVGMRGADLIFYRGILLILILLAVAAFTGTRVRLEPGERKPMLLLALGAALTAILYLTSIDTLPVPSAVVIFYTFPLMVMLATPFVERRPLSARLIVLFLIAFAGLVMALGPALGALNARGVAFAIAAALTNTMLYFVVGRASKSPLRSMLYTQVVALPIALGVALAQHGTLAPLSTFWLAPWAILAMISGYAIGFIFQMLAAQRLAPARMGLLFLAEPATSILVAAIFLGEILSPLQMLGVGLMLAVLAAEFILDRD
ncbi:MAG: DMT family transporter [Proteobacteria bacterium]|nr:DMT family transporter [Pseudomonadota bacterium]